jgi:hypothetical protein
VDDHEIIAQIGSLADEEHRLEEQHVGEAPDLCSSSARGYPPKMRNA